MRRDLARPREACFEAGTFNAQNVPSSKRWSLRRVLRRCCGRMRSCQLSNLYSMICSLECDMRNCAQWFLPCFPRSSVMARLRQNDAVDCSQVKISDRSQPGKLLAPGGAALWTAAAAAQGRKRGLAQMAGKAAIAFPFKKFRIFRLTDYTCGRQYSPPTYKSRFCVRLGVSPWGQPG